MESIEISEELEQIAEQWEEYKGYAKTLYKQNIPACPCLFGLLFMGHPVSDLEQILQRKKGPTFVETEHMRIHLNTRDLGKVLAHFEMSDVPVNRVSLLDLAREPEEVPCRPPIPPLAEKIRDMAEDGLKLGRTWSKESHLSYLEAVLRDIINACEKQFRQERD